MVIAIDIRLLGKKRTGDEMVSRYLTRELVKLESEARLLLLTDETDPEKIVMLEQELGTTGRGNVEIISLGKANRYSWNLFVVARFLRLRKVDIFHTQYILPFFVPKRTKLFAHIHDISFRVFPDLIGWKDRFFLSLLIPRTMRIADRILVPSVFTKEEIINQYRVAKDRIVVIPNAVGDEFLSQATESDIVRVREKYSLPEKFLLAVGTMQPRKNIAFLVRVFAEVSRQIPDLKLVLVGKRYGYRYDLEIEHAIEETGMGESVIFPGYVDAADMPAMYAGAEAFVFPSLYEGFGIPILEALSQGTPVAASDIPPSREISGSGVCFFAPSDIASAVQMSYNVTIDEKLRSELSTHRKEHASIFSWEKSARLLRDIFYERNLNH